MNSKFEIYYLELQIHTVFIHINTPGVMHFSKGGGGGGGTITYKKINSRVQWQWAIMDTYSLDLACQHV